jgi:hypothetical protein
MTSINNFPELMDVDDEDYVLIWNQQTSTTRKVKMLTLKSLFSVPVIPVRVEAEDYFAMSGIQVENSSEGGRNVGFIEPGDWMDYRLEATGGTYRFTFRIASPNNGTQFQIRSGSTILTTVALPNTGGFQSWQSVQSSPVSLSAGQQIIRIHSLSTGWNINWLEFVKV